MDVSHAILFLENADFVRITGLYFPAKFELYNYLLSAAAMRASAWMREHLRFFDAPTARLTYAKRILECIVRL